MPEEEFNKLTAEDRKLLNMMRALRKSEPWQFLENELKEQLRIRRDFYELGDNTTQGALLQREFMRGEISMLRLILELPAQVEESALVALRARQRQYEGDSDDPGTDSGADAGDYAVF